MRLFLGLIGGFVLLIALLIGGLWQRAGRRGAPPVAAQAPVEAADVIAEPPAEQKAPPRISRGIHRRPRVVIEEVAVLRGEVIGGDGDDDQNVRVEADDGTDSFSARVTGRRFELRAPPRRYTLTARDGERIGRLEGVIASPGVNGELTIRLEPAAVIAGTVRGQRGGESTVRVRALRAGNNFEEAQGEVENDGSFELEPLVAGARYDLVVSEDGGRETRVPNVLAPTAGLVVELTRLPVLHGAVGVPAGEACGGEMVTIEAEGYDLELPLGANCRFEAGVPRAADVTVSVTGEGVHYRATVSVPADGDPDFLCLNPPCEPPVLATLEIDVGRHDCDRNHHVVVSTGRGRARTCTVKDGRCLIEQLAPVDEAEVQSVCSRCGSAAQSIKLRPGPNTLTFDCQEERAIQGIVRRMGDVRPPIPVTVRCGPGATRRDRRVTDSFLFELHCRGNVKEIEYQVGGTNGGWRKMAVLGNDNPALVELTVP